MNNKNILSIIITIVIAPFVLVWNILKAIIKGIRRILIDMLKYTYGRIIAVLVTLIAVYLLKIFLGK